MAVKLGSSGNFVKLWQRYLNVSGFPCGSADGDFGKKTDAATRAFQKAHGLSDDGVVGAGTFRKASLNGWSSPDGWPYMPASNFHVSDRKKGDILWIVIHTMEVPEKSYMAFEIARRFCDSNPFSAHFCVDNIDIVQNVLIKDVAIHASQANRKGIGIEHAGYAGQFPEDWRDDFSEKMLKNSAKLTAELCKRMGVPAVWRTGLDLVQGLPGITGHKQVNDAFNKGKGHYDPGLHFPHDEYVDLVKGFMNAA